MPDKVGSSGRRSVIVIAAAWLLFFTGFALCLELPNNRPIRRWELLTLLPGLVDLVAPLPLEADATPAERAIRAHSGWGYFPQRLDLLAVAALILAGAWGLGHLLLRGMRVRIDNGLERTVLAVGAGLSGLSLMTLAAGLAGWLSRPLFSVVIAAAVIAECALCRIRGFSYALQQGAGEGGVAEADSSRAAASRQPREGARIPFSWLWLIVPAPFLLSMVLGAALPSTDFDVNEYHFQGPKEHFQNGRITFLRHNVYTSFPFGTEMLTLLAMVLRGDWYRGALAGKCVLMLFGPLTGLALFAAGRRWFGTTAGILAAVLHLTTPWTYRISTIAYAEGGLSFFLFAALFALLLALEKARSAKRDVPSADHASQSGSSPDPPMSSDKTGHGLLASPVGLFALAGFFAGSAMACKYPGAVTVAVPLFAAAAWGARSRTATIEAPRGGAAPGDRPVRHSTGRRRFVVCSNWLPALRPPLAFAIGVLLAVGPWLAKNLVETGNPVYPLLYTVFDGSDWDPDLNVRWRKAHSPHDFSLLDPDPRKMSLWYSFIDVAARNDWVNPLLGACAVLVLFAREVRRRTAWLCVYVGYLFLTWWLLTHRLDRFWVPMTPVLSLLAGAGAAWLWKAADATGAPLPTWNRRLARGALGLCFCAVTAINLTIVTSPLGGYNQFLLDLNLAGRQATQISAPNIAYLNENLPPGSKVLSVGDAQVFDALFPVVYNTVFDQSIFEEWCGEPSSSAPPGERPMRDAAAIRRKLAAEGVTHVYVNWREILRYRVPGSYGYSDFVRPPRFTELQRQGLLGPAWPIPEAIVAVESLDTDPNEPPRNADELRRFAPELIDRSGGAEVFVTFQVFPVSSP